MLFTSLHEKYSQMELLGNELELNEIVIFNDKLEHTNYFSQMLGGESKQILHDTTNFSSWEPLKQFVRSVEENLPAQNLTFIDINHLYYSNEWKSIFDMIEADSGTSDTQNTLSLNYLSKGWNNVENKNLFLGSLNWMKTMFNDVNKLIESSKMIMNTVFDYLKIMKHFSNENDFNRSMNPIQIDIPRAEITSQEDPHIMFVPMVDCKNDIYFANFMEAVSKSSKTCFIFLEDDETQQGLAQKYAQELTKYAPEIDEGKLYKSHVGVYLPAYWNQGDSPASEIHLSNVMNTISLDVSDNAIQTEGNVFQYMFQLMNSTQGMNINEFTFEIFNMNQNYTQSLDIIYQNLSSIEQYSNITFYYSSIVKFDGIQSTYKPKGNQDEIDQKSFITNISYKNGNKIYSNDTSDHNISLFLNIPTTVEDIIERTMIKNVVMYDTTIENDTDIIQQIQNSLTPNTVLIPFNKKDNSTHEIILKLRDLSEESSVSIDNISIFQDYNEHENFYSMFDSAELFQLDNVKELDPQLDTWEPFKQFLGFLDQEIHVQNIDLLMCKIYSDENWRYVIDNLEQENYNINIRSSDDNTGHIIFEGDWILESETVNVDMIRLYFNEKIHDVEIVLGYLTAEYHIIISDGDVRYNGRNRGEPGSGNTFNKDYSTAVSKPSDFESDEEFVLVANSVKMTMAYTNKNNIYITGDHSDGIGGNNTSWHKFDDNNAYNNTGSVSFLNGRSVICLTNSHHESMYLLLDDGTLWGYGRNQLGQLVNGTTSSSSNFTEITIPDDQTVRQVSANFHMLS